jgi:hypothetical protein
MHMPVGSLCEPVSDRFGLLAGGAIHDHVHVQICGLIMQSAPINRVANIVLMMCWATWVSTVGHP